MTRLTGITVREDSIGTVRLVLASASPRRAELLRAAHIDFDVMPSDVDERVEPSETPDGYVRRLAREKAGAVRARVPDRPVLAADTIVSIDGQILGKPDDEAVARAMLRRLSGREHVTITGVCLLYLVSGSLRRDERVIRTTVGFASLSEAEIDWYVGSGEPMDKAGSYAVQGLASRFVTRIEGSYSNVVGLPIAEVYDLCKTAGLLVS
ncbi:MAG: septum formation inhibitor Maf [Acidobacteria bacterium]|nr:septum formation inhibitor Maf [Acidobacteriota bacterium]